MAKTKTITKTYNYDYDANGVTDTTAVEVSVLDKKGNILEYTWKQDYNVDGVFDYSNHQVNEYNKSGKIVYSMNEGDYDGDGVANYRSETEWQYKRGQTTLELSRYDNEADGIWDGLTRMDATVDRNGNVTERLWRYESADRTVYTFNRDGDLIQEKADWGNDGTWDYVVDIVIA